MRLLESADLARRFRSRGAGIGAEKLDLEPLRPHRRAAQHDERPLAAARAGMEQPRDDFLARARRAGDQHAAVGRADAVELLAKLGDRVGFADEILIPAGTLPQLFVLALQPRRFDRALDDDQQPVRFERLLDEVVSADLDRRDGGFDIAVAADHHDRDMRQLALDDLQNLEPVELAALQPDIEHDKRRLARADRRQRLGAVAGLARLVAFVAEDAAHQARGYRLRRRRPESRSPSIRLPPELPVLAQRSSAPADGTRASPGHRRLPDHRERARRDDLP